MKHFIIKFACCYHTESGGFKAECSTKSIEDSNNIACLPEIKIRGLEIESPPGPSIGFERKKYIRGQMKSDKMKSNSRNSLKSDQEQKNKMDDRQKLIRGNNLRIF